MNEQRPDPCDMDKFLNRLERAERGIQDLDPSNPDVAEATAIVFSAMARLHKTRKTMFERAKVLGIVHRVTGEVLASLCDDIAQQ